MRRIPLRARDIVRFAFFCALVALPVSSLPACGSRSARPQGPTPPPDEDDGLLEGILDAEDFRRELVSRGLAARLASALADRVGGLDADAALAHILGIEADDSLLLALAPFAGRWEGMWRREAVRHDWQPVRTLPCAMPLRAGLEATAVQYAWVGDGHGWNVIVRAGGHALLLGTVLHLDPESGAPAYRVPHVGVPLGSGAVAWIVPGFLYIERVDPRGRYEIAELAWSETESGLRVHPTYRTSYRRPGAAVATR